MKCEICGRDIKGKGYKVVIDRATLIVCEKCAKSLKAPRYEISSGVSERGATRRMFLPRRTYKSYRLEPEYEIVEDFAERIREARESLGLTRELLARMVGEKESTIRRIESGTLIPSINLARKLEKVLKIVLVVENPLSLMEEQSSSSQKYELTLGDVVKIKKKEKKR